MEEEEESTWWLTAFKKLREWLELVGGQRWKMFIWRFNKTRGGCCRMWNGKLFQYDPLNYALNFDDGALRRRGAVRQDRAEGALHSDFLSRYEGDSGLGQVVDGSGEGRAGVLVSEEFIFVSGERGSQWLRR
ncbi:hypothetical protein RHSIM_Rhsim05G0204400 [Rhododendron simsii]|uniref:Uncharacterized protein n=1 Tax=Rhododendron simsii TaxID=118357 RepID=A0A834LLT2_RHOSS|nr:hypothetical protein RHSIM_Rhsim05G0204400 [Rhododendron simsii]